MTLDQVVRWVRDHLTLLPVRFALLVALPVVVWAVYVAVGSILRTLLPWSARRLFRPAVIVAAGLAGVALLGVQALLTLPFRLVRVRPPGLLYAAGDLVIAGTRGAQGGAQWLAEVAQRLGRLPSSLCLLATVGVLWWWNRSTCGPDPATDCQSTLGTWWAAVADSWRTFTS